MDSSYKHLEQYDVNELESAMKVLLQLCQGNEESGIIPVNYKVGENYF